VVVLFGPETPVLFAPLGNARIISARLPCSPCVSVYNQRRSACRDNQCMQRINVADVLEATLQYLSAANPSPLRPLARTTSE
jgi:ADP-heptose:LPS heptosyltransferase